MSTHIVNTHGARSRLSELIGEAEAGTDVIVARRTGTWHGRVEHRADPPGPDDDVAALFDESANAAHPRGC